MKRDQTASRFALCIESGDSDDLETRKVYRVIADEDAARDGYLRVVDESGEDYLYPASYFVFVTLPKAAQKALLPAS